MRTDLTKVDVRLAVTDDPVGDLPVHIRCREEGHAAKDREQSMAVYADHVWCYGCGKRVLRRMDALAYLLGVPVYEAIQGAARYTNESLDAYRQRAGEEARRDPLPLSLARSYATLLWGSRRARIDWFRARGLTDRTIRAARLGHDASRFTIPIADATGQLVSIRFRRDDTFGTSYTDPKTGEDRALPKYAGMYRRNGTYLYPEWLIARTRPDTLVVCEGELDALLLWQQGIPAVSTTNGAGNVKHIPELLRDWGYAARRLWVATDMDEPGEVAARDTMRVAEELGVEAIRLRWPFMCGKDITELHQGGRTLRDAGYTPD